MDRHTSYFFIVEWKSIYLLNLIIYECTLREKYSFPETRSYVQCTNNLFYCFTDSVCLLWITSKFSPGKIGSWFSVLPLHNFLSFPQQSIHFKLKPVHFHVFSRRFCCFFIQKLCHSCLIETYANFPFCVSEYICLHLLIWKKWLMFPWQSLRDSLVEHASKISSETPPVIITQVSA